MNTLSTRRANHRRGIAKVESEMAAFRADQAAERASEHEAEKAARREAREAEKARPKLTTADVKGARIVRDQFGWHEVVRVSAKSVTVKTAYSWTDRISLDKILEVRA